MGAVLTIAKLLLALFEALGYANNLAERRAGAAQSQKDADDAEIARVNRAAAAADGVRDNAPDPNDLDQ